MGHDQETTTRLLNRLGVGDAEAEELLIPLVYAELHRLAEQHMAKQGPRHTLQPTELVNEAWMRIAGQDRLDFSGRDSFYALASRVMRSVLVDHARARNAEKRGGGRRRITLGEHQDQKSGIDIDVLALDEALVRLSEMDAELLELVELRFFGGLTHPEIARLKGVSLRSVERTWRLARAWLHAELS